MRRFKFNLESVFVVKQKLLEDERLKLAKALSIVEKQKEILKNLENELLNIQNEVSELANNKEINVTIMTTYSSYLKKLANDIVIEKLSLKEANNALIKQQKQVNLAYISVKTLEKLRDKQKEEYLKECIQEENKILDDLSTFKKRNLAIT